MARKAKEETTNEEKVQGADTSLNEVIQTGEFKDNVNESKDEDEEDDILDSEEKAAMEGKDEEEVAPKKSAAKSKKKEIEKENDGLPADNEETSKKEKEKVELTQEQKELQVQFLQATAMQAR